MKKVYVFWAFSLALFFAVFTSCEPDAVLNSDNSILSFKIVNLDPNISASIDLAAATVSITVPYATDVSSLKVELELAEGASSLPESGTMVNFSENVIFTVTAEDGTAKDYKVSVIKEKADYVYDFETLSLSANSYWSGPDTRVQPVVVNLYGVDCDVYYGSFSEKNAEFSNTYNATWFSWSGFAYSNLIDKETAGYSNQYSVYADGGFNESANFAVAYAPASANPITEIVFETSLSPQKMFVTNSTYAYLAMKNGDAYTTAFADGDYLSLEITGFDEQGAITNTLTVYLADYRNGQTIMLNDWTETDLSSLGKVKKMGFKLQASQSGVPTYFCMDNLEALQ